MKNFLVIIIRVSNAVFDWPRMIKSSAKNIPEMLMFARLIPRPVEFNKDPRLLINKETVGVTSYTLKSSKINLVILKLIIPCLTPCVKNNSSVYLPLMRKRILSLVYIDSIKLSVLPPNPSLVSLAKRAGLHTLS